MREYAAKHFDEVASKLAAIVAQRDELCAVLVDTIRLELGESYDGSTQEQAENMRRARAAIAKARGK